MTGGTRNPPSQSVLLYEAPLEVGDYARLHVVHGGAYLAFGRRATDIPCYKPEGNELVDAFF